MHSFKVTDNADEGFVLQLLGEIRVESIFNRVVGPTRDFSSDATPLVAVDAIQSDYFHIFFYRPFVLADIWIQVDVPAFSALLTNTSW